MSVHDQAGRDDVRPTCLLITQAVPAYSGHGASMRVGLSLEALASRFRVTLLVLSDNPLVDPEATPDAMKSQCSKVLAFRIAPGGETNLRFLDPQLLRWNLDSLSEAVSYLHGQHFDHVHIFRLRLMTIWRVLRKHGIASDHTVLDLDDIESRTLKREIQVKGLDLGRLGLLRSCLEVAKLMLAERKAMAETDAVLVCSDGDRELIARLAGQQRVAVLPNGARLPQHSLPTRKADGSVHLLFVGSMFYAPNQHAARYLVEEILPAIRAHVAVSVSLDIVGRRPPEWIKNYSSIPGVAIHADVQSLVPHYESADIVVVPITFGGGTRIKIIEAFGYGRPVVTTRIGAEGLSVQDRRQLLFAETPAEFALVVGQLFNDSAMYAGIVAQARKLAEEEYSPQSFTKRLLQIHSTTDHQ